MSTGNIPNNSDNGSLNPVIKALQNKLNLVKEIKDYK